MTLTQVTLPMTLCTIWTSSAHSRHLPALLSPRHLSVLLSHPLPITCFCPLPLSCPYFSLHCPSPVCAPLSPLAITCRCSSSPSAHDVPVPLSPHWQLPVSAPLPLLAMACPSPAFAFLPPLPITCLCSSPPLPITCSPPPTARTFQVLAPLPDARLCPSSRRLLVLLPTHTVHYLHMPLRSSSRCPSPACALCPPFCCACQPQPCANM